MTAFPAPRRVELPPDADREGMDDPLTLSVHDAGEGPAVVLCHGFPELAYSWRHQFEPLVAAGFRVIAPDMRGYGGSDCPEPAESYDILHLTGDLVRLLDALGIERAVFAGHDWGGFVAWAMPVLHPERTLGVIGVNTPYLPRAPLPPTQMLTALAGGDTDRHYILWFQKPGVAEAVLDATPRLVFEKLMRRPPTPEEIQAAMASGDGDMNPFKRLAELPERDGDLLDSSEIDVYAETFARTGFRGGISWYRNFDRNWEKCPAVGSEKIDVPCLMVTAELDFALPPAMAEGMPALIPDLEMTELAGCGHWTQQEQPEALGRTLADWLTRRFGSGS